MLGPGVGIAHHVRSVALRHNLPPFAPTDPREALRPAPLSDHEPKHSQPVHRQQGGRVDFHQPPHGVGHGALVRELARGEMCVEVVEAQGLVQAQEWKPPETVLLGEDQCEEVER